MWQNAEICQFNKIGDDIQHWALSDKDRAFLHSDMLENVVTKAWPMLWNMIDMFDIIKTNDLCFTDEQLIDEYAAVWGDICENIVMLYGMEPLNWYHTETYEHMPMNEYKKLKKDYKAEHKWERLGRLGGWIWGQIQHLMQ